MLQQGCHKIDRGLKLSPNAPSLGCRADPFAGGVRKRLWTRSSSSCRSHLSSSWGIELSLAIGDAFPHEVRDGRVAEWFKAPVLKTGVPARAPWVRIPPLPPDIRTRLPLTKLHVPITRADGGEQPFLHHVCADPISAAFGLRYIHTLLRRWAASGNAAAARLT
jgi:hypothetical protein